MGVSGELTIRGGCQGLVTSRKSGRALPACCPPPPPPTHPYTRAHAFGNRENSVLWEGGGWVAGTRKDCWWIRGWGGSWPCLFTLSHPAPQYNTWSAAAVSRARGLEGCESKKYGCLAQCLHVRRGRFFFFLPGGSATLYFYILKVETPAVSFHACVGQK